MKTRIPTVRTPKPVIFGSAIVLGAFFFWFTKSAQGESEGGVGQSSETGG